MNRIVVAASGLILVWLTGYILIAGRGLIIPLVIAIFIWNLLNTLVNAMSGLPYVGGRLPYWFRMLLSLGIVSYLVKILIDIIANNVNDVISASSRYQDNLLSIFNTLDQRFHIQVMSNFDNMIKNLSVQQLFLNLYGVFTSITSSAVLIALYVIFLFVEQHFFYQKINAIFLQKSHRDLVNNIIVHIARDTQTYLGLKTLMSLITATSSWIIMKALGLDFAEFWALLIFFLNYIPNIGSILATMFPAMLALIQFQTWWPFFAITSGIIAIQFIVGNIIEPKFLGKQLNLSPLIILIALGVWGAIWGILGMFLSVPITVMLMIIFAHFDATRPIAIILSQDGYVQHTYAKIEK